MEKYISIKKNISPKLIKNSKRIAILKKTRKKHKLTQSELASLTGYSKSLIANCEQGIIKVSDKLLIVVQSLFR